MIGALVLLWSSASDDAGHQPRLPATIRLAGWLGLTAMAIVLLHLLAT